MGLSVSVHDTHVMNTDAKSYLSKTPEKCLQEAEQAKRKIYLEACFQERRHFPPFFTSLDGILGVEGVDNLKRIAIYLSKNWRQPYSRRCSYVKCSIAISLVQDTNRCIRGSRVPAHKIIIHLPQWENGAGLNLFI